MEMFGEVWTRNSFAGFMPIWMEKQFAQTLDNPDRTSKVQ